MKQFLKLSKTGIKKKNSSYKTHGVGINNGAPDYKVATLDTFLSRLPSDQTPSANSNSYR